MSLVQGYSSSEDEEIEDKQSKGKQEILPALILPLPNSRNAQRRHLPLLEDVMKDNFSDDEDDDFKINGSSEVTLTRKPSQSELHSSNEEYRSDLVGSTNKRHRISHDIDEDNNVDELKARILKKMTSNIGGGAQQASTGQFPAGGRFQDDPTAMSNLKQPPKNAIMEQLKRELPDELRSANSSAIFAELNSRDIRQEAQRYQQGGITTNLHKTKGVSGRQNQIAFLAKAASKQRENS